MGILRSRHALGLISQEQALLSPADLKWKSISGRNMNTRIQQSHDNDDSLWLFIYGGRASSEESAYREHYRRADIRRGLGIAWACAGMLFTINILDLINFEEVPNIWIGITIRTIALGLTAFTIVLLNRNPGTRQMDAAMLILSISIVAGLLWIHYAQEVSAARMVAVGAVVIFGGIIGIPGYPIIPLLAAMVIMLVDGLIIYFSPDPTLKEAAPIIMVAYSFAAVFATITSANHHRARYHAFIARSQVKTLEGILPICAHCKKIRDDRGYYQQLEKYLSEHSEASFSHGICPDCLARYYAREK